MAIAISAWFDNQTEAFVRDIWSRLAETGLSHALHDGPYRPHVTLAVYDRADVPALARDLRLRLASETPFSITLAGLGAFLNDPPTAQLTVTVTQRLHRIHQLVHELLTEHGEGPWAYHVPDRWNPHCTLAFALGGESFPRAMGHLSSILLPREATVTRLGIIDTPAEVELEEVPLRGAIGKL